MAYQALYRQYRPARFADMVGQEHIVQALRNQVASGRIGHVACRLPEGRNPRARVSLTPAP